MMADIHTSPNTPLFFTELEHFKRLIPQQAISVSQHANLPLQPLLHSYLSHYQIDFVQKKLAHQHAIWQSHIGTNTIVQQCWQVESAKGNLLIVHGYLDHSGLYGRLIEWALKNHFNVYCFDLPGHGLSSGPRAAIDDFTEYTQVFTHVLHSIPTNTTETTHSANHRKALNNTMIVGQSTGCAIVSDYLLDNPETIFKHVFLFAPLVRSYQWKILRWIYFACRPFIHSIKRKFIASSHDKVFNRFIEHHDPLQARRISVNWLGAMETWYQKIDRRLKKPSKYSFIQKSHSNNMTIVQGTSDQTVDWHYNLPALETCFPHITCVYIEGARHHLVKETSKYWQKIEQALDSQ